MHLEQFLLTDKVAIVTGGGRGLGRQMALALARAGAHIVVAARTQEQIESAAADVRALGRRAIAVRTDVRDSAQVDSLVVRCLDEFGRLDIMLSNAGIGEAAAANKEPWEITDELWLSSMQLNLFAAFYGARAASRPMIQQGGGVIINVSSGSALRGFPQGIAYASAKSGVISLTKSLAMALLPRNIRVNCIIPGFISQGPERAEQKQMLDALLQFIPVQRVGQAWEMGPLAVFLASDASSYLTGQAIALDGGGLCGGYAPVGFSPLSQT